MILSDLFNGQTVTYRLGKHGDTNVNWQPWITGKIYVVRREKAFKNHPAGELLTMTPLNQAWAEYGEKDYHGNGFFDAEEYCMEIKELK